MITIFAFVGDVLVTNTLIFPPCGVEAAKATDPAPNAQAVTPTTAASLPTLMNDLPVCPAFDGYADPERAPSIVLVGGNVGSDYKRALCPSSGARPYRR